MRKKLAANPLPVVLFTIFVDLLGLGILIPVIPLLLAAPNSPYYILSGQVTPTQGFILLGFLVASYPFMQFLATPILGQLSDRFGRKKVLALSLLGTSISYAIFAIGIITRNIPLLFISRAFDGITGGNLSVAQAAIADVTAPEHRAKNFGLIGAAFGFGFIMGPYIGGKLSDPTVVSWFNATTPFWFAAGLAMLNVIFVLTLFPETLKTFAHHLTVTWTKSITNIFHAFTYGRLRILFTTNFLFQAGFSFFTTFFSVYLIYRFNFSQGNIGDFFAYVGIWIAFAQAVVTRRVSGIFEEAHVLRLSLFLTGIFIALYLFQNHAWELLLVAPFFAIFNGLSQANIVALVSRSAGAEIQGEVLGINASVVALGQAIPPVLSGYIAASLAPKAPIYVASFVIVVSALVFMLMFRPQAKIAHE